MTRNEYVAAHASMGRNARLRRLVPRTRNAAGIYVDVILGRIYSARVNRVRSNRSLTSEERLALADQRSYFAGLLAKLPTPRLP